MRITSLVLLLAILASSAYAQESFDLVVYGGTAGGVMTAVSGARQALRTVLLEPGVTSAVWPPEACPAPIRASDR